MADIEYDLQGKPATPGAGKSLLYPSSGSRQWTSLDEAGLVLSLPGVKEANIANEVASAADTYLAGAKIAIPPHGLQAKTIYKCRIFMTKSAAGVAAPTWNVRLGTLGTVGDTARLTFTGTAQTAAVDTAFVEITAIMRNIGAAGILQGGLSLQKSAVTAVGFTNTVGGLVLVVTSAAFDTTTPTFIGLSVNPGASGVWTHQIVKSELLND